MTRPKVFQIGFNRCGTRAIAQLFRDNGYRAAHCDEGHLARDLDLARRTGDVPFAQWADVDFFSDLEALDYDTGALVEGYRHYAYLERMYPNAVFLLNHRNRTQWLYSRMRHRSGRYMEFYARHYRASDPRDVLTRWIADWESHLAEVRGYFANKPGKLIDFAVDRDPIERLTSALAPHYRLDPERYAVVGALNGKAA